LERKLKLADGIRRPLEPPVNSIPEAMTRTASPTPMVAMEK
jgi:hypothetical protein